MNCCRHLPKHLSSKSDNILITLLKCLSSNYPTQCLQKLLLLLTYQDLMKLADLHYEHTDLHCPLFQVYLLYIKTVLLISIIINTDLPPMRDHVHVHPPLPSIWCSEVSPSYLEIIIYKDSTTRSSGQIRILAQLAPQWKMITNLLGIKPATITAIECPGTGKDFYTCLMESFEHWRQNSSQLPNYSLFPNTWRGIYNLLQESGYGNLAGKLEIALKADISNIHGNYTEGRHSGHSPSPTSASLMVNS